MTNDYGKMYFLIHFILYYIIYLNFLFTFLSYFSLIKFLDHHLIAILMCLIKIEIIPTGINLSKFTPSFKKRDNILLYVGRLAPEKTWINFVKIFRLIISYNLSEMVHPEMI